MGRLKLLLGKRSGSAPPEPSVGDFFVDALGGNDAAAGSELAPFRYIPGDPAAGAGVAAMALAAGDIVSLKRGQRHRPASYASRDSSHIQLKASGASGSPIVYQAYGSGAAPKVSGDEVISSWAPATEAEVGYNPLWADIDVASVTGVSDVCQMLFEGDDFHVPAQWPTGNDIYSFNRVTPGISNCLTVSVADFPTKVVTGANDSGGSGRKLVTLISDTGTGNFKDHYTADGAPVPGAARIVCFMSGAQYTEWDITGYDVATGAVTFTIPNGSTALHVSGSSSGLFRYAMRYNPFDIRKPGQYGWGPDVAGVRKLYGMFRGSAERSLARSIPNGVRLTRDYITLKDLDLARFGGAAGQAILQTSVEGARQNLSLDSVVIEQCANQSGNWLIYLSQTGGLNDSTFTNIRFEDCLYNGGIALVNCSNVVVDGFEQREEGRTPIYVAGTSQDIAVRNFNVSDWGSAHGNGPSPYEKAQRVTFENGYAMARPRGLSTQTTLTEAEGDRDLIIRNFISTTRKPLSGAFSESNLAWQGATGERGTLVEGVIFGISPSVLHPSAGGAASTGMIIRNAVISSLVCNELPGISFENCLIFQESGGGITSVTAKGATDLGGVVYATSDSWNGVITEAMQQALTRNVGGSGYTARSLGHGDYPWVVPGHGTGFALEDCRLLSNVFRAYRDVGDTLSSVIQTQPGSVITIPASHDGALFALWKGQISCAELLPPGTYTLPILQTNAHPHRTGPSTLLTLITVTMI